MRTPWIAALALLGCAAPPPSRPPSTAAPAAPSPSAEAPPTLDDVIARHAVSFDPGTLAPSLVAAMAAQRVVMLGEHHGYREHHDLLLSIVRALHEHGTRWVLFEGFQAESWSVDAYVNGTIDSLSESTRKYFGHTLDGLRAFNRSLPASERVHVALIDIDHRPWAFPLALARMSDHLDLPSCLDVFLREAGWDASLPIEDAKAGFEAALESSPAAYETRLEAVGRRLRDGSCSADADGDRPERAPLTEMAEVALDSLRIRAIWDSEGERAAHPAREEAIKAMVDRRLAATTGPVVLNMGGFHLQKTHVMGMPKEWVGEHLASPSHPAGGRVIRLYVQFVRAERSHDGETSWWSLSDDAPPGELLTALHRHTEGKAAYLPVTDGWFERNVIPVSYMSQVAEHAPGKAFDGYVLLPEGHKLY